MNADPEFFAWLDGELDAEAAARMDTRVAASPELQALAEQHRALALRLRAAFDPVLSDAPAAVAGPREGKVVDLAAVRERRRPATPIWAQAAAIAATLVLGITVGSQMLGGRQAPIAERNGHLIAAAALDHALETRLASAADIAGPRIGLTFRDRSGAVCRSFATDSASGLACRDQGNWRIRGMFEAGEGQSGDYRMAAGPDPRLMDMIGEIMAGEPLDASGEEAARAGGWQ